MAKKIGEASGYTGSAFLDRSVIGNVQKGSYGLPGDSDKKSRYHQTLSRPATFGDYFKDAKDKFGKLKKIASKIYVVQRESFFLIHGFSLGCILSFNSLRKNGQV